MISYELMKKINKNKCQKMLSEESILHAEQIKKEMNYAKEMVDLFITETKNDQKKAFLVGHFNLLGGKNEDAKMAYLNYANAPSQETWNNFRGFCILGFKTAWQIWCEHDENAPRSGSEGGHPTPENFDRYYVSARENEKRKYQREYLRKASEYYSILYKGFRIETTLGSKCKLFNDLNELIMIGSYIEIFETLKEKQKLNEMYFVLDWVTLNVYENEKLEQFLNEEL